MPCVVHADLVLTKPGTVQMTAYNHIQILPASPGYHRIDFVKTELTSVFSSFLFMQHAFSDSSKYVCAIGVLIDRNAIHRSNIRIPFEVIKERSCSGSEKLL